MKKSQFKFYDTKISFKEVLDMDFKLCKSLKSLQIVNESGKLMSVYCLANSTEEAYQNIRKSTNSLGFLICNRWVDDKLEFIQDYLVEINKDYDKSLIEVGKMGCVYGLTFFFESRHLIQFDIDEYLEMWIKIMIKNHINQFYKHI